MTRIMLATIVLVGVLPVTSSVQLAGQQPPINEPGRPTQARMVIVNGRDAAVPVVLQAGGEVQPVTLVGTASVSVAPDTTVGARSVRQMWEYKAIRVPTGEDPTSTLNDEGAAGWEVVGVLSPGSGAASLLLKRPR